MALKAVVAFLLILGTLRIDIVDSKKVVRRVNYDASETPDYYWKEKHSQNERKWYEKRSINEDKKAASQFEKDYSRWDDKKYLNHDLEEMRQNKHYMKMNEIDSNEFVDKYNKYGNLFHPEIVDAHVKEEKIKRYSKHDEKPTGEGKPGSLLHDTDVNYLNNNKKISGDSELITEKTVNSYGNKEKYQPNYQNGNGMPLERYKKDFYQNIKKIDLTNPPPTNDTILMARYIIHTVDWAAVATLSGRPSNKGSPFLCVKATSDGLQNAPTGIPFFYISPLEMCTQDLQKDNRASVLVTLSETEYCKNNNFDPQDPRCARLTLSGKIKPIKRGSDEEKFAKEALFSRHPVMATWPTDHRWFFAKLKIGQVVLLDKFGGATFIKVKDYLNGGPIKPEL